MLRHMVVLSPGLHDAVRALLETLRREISSRRYSEAPASHRQRNRPSAGSADSKGKATHAATVLISSGGANGRSGARVLAAALAASSTPKRQTNWPSSGGGG